MISYMYNKLYESYKEMSDMFEIAPRQDRDMTRNATKMRQEMRRDMRHDNDTSDMTLTKRNPTKSS